MIRRGGRMEPSTRRALLILPVWVGSLYWMWSWWLTSARVNFLPLFVLMTGALFYEFAVLPSLFLYFVIRAMRPPRRVAPKALKVAVISLCVPSKESFDIVERQLQSMAAINYPHDSWILDEGNSKVIKALAKKYHVKVFSRKGIRKYNQLSPPFKEKTKAGNVNAWLDHVKRRKYDFFVQLDIDHLPKPNYLHKTLGFFRDEKVAWVQAPSVYKNLQNWTARGSAEQELTLQGPLQMGFYGHSSTPFIIGSHTTYRTAAVTEIGGFQPTRAEDHLDTLALASRGYTGVFLPEIIAEGDGPETLTTYLAQQFAWAYSMFQVLVHHSPNLFKTMSFRRKWQFLFSETWYPIWSLCYCVMFLAPLAALVMNRDIANVKPQELLWHFGPLFISGFLVWWSARPIMLPKSLFLSWRGMVLHAVRWPVILMAIFSAAFKIQKPYMITPKGRYSRPAPSLQTYKPFLLLAMISLAAIVFSSIRFGERALYGQLVFAFTNVIFMLTICLIDIHTRLKEVNMTSFNLDLEWLKPIAAVIVLTVLASGAFIMAPIASQQNISALLFPRPAIAEAVSLTPVPVSQMTTEQLITELQNLPLPIKPTAQPSTGIFNPQKAPLPTSQPYIQHIFIDWNNPDMMARQLVLSLRAGNVPLITLEPRGEPDGQLLLQNIANGTYDEKLKKITDVLKANRQPVYIRFAHEMELIDLYPWGNQDPQLFIQAYRHVVTYARDNGATNVQWVWSPAGNYGATAYYPGDDVVDIVGTTVLYDEYFYPDYRPSFEDIAGQRLKELQHLNKPLWIVEFGVGKNDPVFQHIFIGEALAQYSRLGFSALIYLNIADSNVSGPNYELNQNLSPLALFVTPKISKPAVVVVPVAKKKSSVCLPEIMDTASPLGDTPINDLKLPTSFTRIGYAACP